MARILIVEDSPDNMKLFRTILGLKGHEVFSLTGGEGLTDEIQRQSPSHPLVLMGHTASGKGRLFPAAGDPGSHRRPRFVSLP